MELQLLPILVATGEILSPTVFVNPNCIKFFQNSFLRFWSPKNKGKNLFERLTVVMVSEIASQNPECRREVACLLACLLTSTKRERVHDVTGNGDEQGFSKSQRGTVKQDEVGRDASLPSQGAREQFP
ncbi:hypothetical protein QLX08_001546 [Tetragonisca angustula]|uniref:Uncharacterized protein n=1 Tax=Tetragonisca angustula TaxID=166442 RepID=A0AAW1AEP2_9HYME